ncbi:MAG: DUF3343 domain-containing protein [Desulfotomaculaceae bacterium]|nr:DUF3343 domain-containing protein [Desulfotomaculaceae bacterium]
MRKKEVRLVITFETTTNAMAMEKICKEKGGNGRIIPVPREITAGCGLAWCAEPKAKESLMKLMEDNNLKYDKVYEIEI